MTENVSSEDRTPVDLLAETEDLYRQAAEDLARARRSLRQGKFNEAALSLQAAKDLKQAFTMVMNEREHIAKLRRQVAGVVHDHALDFDAARAEIGRRLACLRDAGGGG